MFLFSVKVKANYGVDLLNQDDSSAAQQEQNAKTIHFGDTIITFVIMQILLSIATIDELYETLFRNRLYVRFL